MAHMWIGHYLDLCLDLWTNIYVLVRLANVCDVLYRLLYVILCLLLYTYMPILEASHRRVGSEHVLDLKN
jgi:hypothetical protein